MKTSFAIIEVDLHTDTQVQKYKEELQRCSSCQSYEYTDRTYVMANSEILCEDCYYS